MLRISEKGDEIIIRDVDLRKFVFASLMIFAISYLLFFKISVSGDPFFFVAGIVMLIVDIYKLSFLETKTIKINKQKRILSANSRSLVKNVSHVYRFGEINDLISVETLTDSDGNKNWKLVFPLETGEKIDLSRAVSTGVERYFEAADVINNLIFDNPKQIPQNFTGFNKF